MKTIYLTEHFTLQEFTRSNNAGKYGIDNTVPSHFIPRLEQLCKTILEPLREFAGQLKGRNISIGYSDEELVMRC